MGADVGNASSARYIVSNDLEFWRVGVVNQSHHTHLWQKCWLCDPPQWNYPWYLLFHLLLPLPLALSSLSFFLYGQIYVLFGQPSQSIICVLFGHCVTEHHLCFVLSLVTEYHLCLVWLPVTERCRMTSRAIRRQFRRWTMRPRERARFLMRELSVRSAARPSLQMEWATAATCATRRPAPDVQHVCWGNLLLARIRQMWVIDVIVIDVSVIDVSVIGVSVIDVSVIGVST